ncbi:uncharacterized protein DS421_3g76570 [Arachis hypogaea]|nr:uncharacterized protein DS421_3g76570 [Arachis hypogaea]
MRSSSNVSLSTPTMFPLSEPSSTNPLFSLSQSCAAATHPSFLHHERKKQKKEGRGGLATIDPPCWSSPSSCFAAPSMESLARATADHRRARMRRKDDVGIEREAEVVWHNEGGGLFGLPFAPSRLSRSAAVALLTATARACGCHLTTADKHRRREKSEKTRGEKERPEVELGSRCWTMELCLYDSDRREWFCDFREHRRSFWLLLSSSENSIGHRYCLRWLPPNQFRDRRCFGSAVPSSVRLSFDCCMLRLELLRLLQKWLGAEVLVAGDFELWRKELMRRLDYGICILR